MNKPTYILVSSLSLLIIVSLALQKNVTSIQAASSDIVISEVQIGGQVANDEFVELYNPTNTSIDLSGWRLSRRSAALSGSLTNLVSNMSGVIEPKSYYLIANPSYTGSTIPDLLYSATTSGIAINNTVILFRDNGQTVVDKVAMGTAEDVETSATSVPENNASIERKANALSTAITMQPGGLDELLGNGYDTDNNSQDFIVRPESQPQNKQSTQEQLNTVPTNTPSPSLIPTQTPSPTETPPLTPTEVPTVTLTITPTVTVAPTTPTPSPIPTPTITIFPTPTTRQRIREYAIPPYNKLVCTWNYVSIHILTKTFWLPSIHCEVIPI